MNVVAVLAVAAGYWLSGATPFSNTLVKLDSRSIGELRITRGGAYQASCDEYPNTPAEDIHGRVEPAKLEEVEDAVGRIGTPFYAQEVLNSYDDEVWSIRTGWRSKEYEASTEQSLQTVLDLLRHTCMAAVRMGISELDAGDYTELLTQP